MDSKLINSDPAEPLKHTRAPHTDPSAPTTHATDRPTEAPRPTWVHAAPTPEELLEHAERAVGDRYRIETLAGEGGMGRVFSARDTKLGRRVAIKLLTVLDPHAGEDPGLHAHGRLVAEARAMARLNHPGLCRVIEVSLVGQTPYLVMDWIDGVPFDRFCHRLDVKRKLSVLLQVLDAVAEMHHVGLVHGDIKPSNILIGRDEKTTIVDFGLARAETDPSWIAAPRGGTPGYAAPELLTGGTPVGPEADVFAFGVMLYEILTSRFPFDLRLAPAVMIDLLNRGAIPLPEQHAPDTPADLQKICLAALEPEPNRRYPDAASMAADIRRYLRRETVAARPRILEARFDQQVETQLAQTAEWRRLGMITPRESELVSRVLTDLQRAESPWIVDARRLRASQVSLYLGGWILLLGLVVGLADIRDLIPPAVTLGTAWALSAVTLTLGWRLQHAGQKRVGIGMLVTALAAVTASAWLTLRQTGWLAGSGGIGNNTALELTSFLALTSSGSPLPGLANTQILTVAAVGLAVAALLRHHTRAAAFTVFIVLFATSLWLAGYLVLGGLHDETAPSIGRGGIWLALLGAVFLPVGLAIDAHEHSLIRELGRRRAKRRDAAPILCGALVATLIGLTTAALATPGWYVARTVDGRSLDPADWPWAFLINGLAVVLLMALLGRRTTPLRRRLAEVLRWILPSHLLMPLLFMEINGTFGVWLPWLLAMPTLAFAFCLASALKQWKPFLISGLVYLAIAYARGFVRIDAELAGLPAWRIALTAAFLILGPALMLVAWKAPAWIASRRLRRWALAAPPRRPTHTKSWR